MTEKSAVAPRLRFDCDLRLLHELARMCLVRSIERGTQAATQLNPAVCSVASVLRSKKLKTLVESLFLQDL